jgi:hypothetical protein
MSTDVDPNAEEFPINFAGNVPLDQTCRGIKTIQEKETANLTSVEPVVNEKDNGTKVKVNIANFKRADGILDVLDDIKCFDVSTPQGAANAASAQHDYKPVWSGKIWVNDKLTDVHILGRTTP